MSLIFMTLLIAVFGGFLVAFATGIVEGKSKAHRLPGGSAVFGLIIGILMFRGLLPIFAGLVFGFSGWLLYCGIFPADKDEMIPPNKEA